MATKAQNARQPYGLTDELVDSLLNGSTSHEEVFGEDGIYRQLTKRLFRANPHSFYIYGTLEQTVYLYTDVTKFYTDLTCFLHRFVVNITRM